MDPSELPKTAKEWSERWNGGGPPTDDDQSRTWDGRILDTKEKVLEFLAEVEEARKAGRSLDPYDKQP